MTKTANKVPQQTFLSRLSKMQKEIIAFLATTPAPFGNTLPGLPRTGDIIDALARERTASSYAAISKALRRLEERGLVSSVAPSMALRGKGLRYYLTRGEPTTGRYGVTVMVLSRSKAAKRYRNSMTIDA